MTDRELNKKLARIDSKFQHIINFIGIQIFLTLALMGLLGVEIIEFKPMFKKMGVEVQSMRDDVVKLNESVIDIHNDFNIFQSKVPYDAKRHEIMQSEKDGNYHDYDNNEFEGFGVEEDSE